MGTYAPTGNIDVGNLTELKYFMNLSILEKNTSAFAYSKNLFNS